MAVEASKTDADPPRSSIEELNDLSNITYLLYRRNKNQHRRSHWWKHFNIFRRQLQHLCADFKGVKQPASSTSLTFNDKAKARIDAWVKFYVPKWWTSFSQILSEKRFAAFGVAILAVLAKVCDLTGINEVLAISQFGSAEPLASLSREQSAMKMMSEDDDIGIAIARSTKTVDPWSIEQSQDNTKETPTISQGPASQRRTKTLDRTFGTRNVIDKIFDTFSSSEESNDEKHERPCVSLDRMRSTEENILGTKPAKKRDVRTPALNDQDSLDDHGDTETQNKLPSTHSGDIFREKKHKKRVKKRHAIDNIFGALG